LDPKVARPWLWSLGGGALPLFAYFGLSMILNFMRPDLMRPMLDHIFGFLLISAVVFLSCVNLFVTRLLLLVRHAGVRLGLVLVFQLLAVFGAVFVALFAPIIFAFMFGDTGRPASGS
jgi:hypothetical protein